MNTSKLQLFCTTLILLFAAGTLRGPAAPNPVIADWQTTLQQRLPLYGHRNWIVVSDAAFPAYSQSGIETMVVNQDLPAVVVRQNSRPTLSLAAVTLLRRRFWRGTTTMILPRAWITWLGLLLAAPLCLAQDQPKAGRDVQPAVLIHRVSPDYPNEWKKEGLQGTVHLRATIAKDGSVKDITVVDGDALLAKSAQSAFKQWRYKPAMRNGEPVEVQTTVAIAFALKPVH